MIKKTLLGCNNAVYNEVKIDTVLFDIENQNSIREMYRRELLSETPNKYAILALVILMNSHYKVAEYNKFQEAKDIDGDLDLILLSSMIKDIRKSLRPSKSKLLTICDKESRKVRDAILIKYIEEGMNYAEAARKCNVSDIRAKQIYFKHIKIKAMRYKKSNKESCKLFSVLSYGYISYLYPILVSNNLKTVEEVVDALDKKVDIRFTNARSIKLIKSAISEYRHNGKGLFE